jgi:hypothetical protein
MKKSVYMGVTKRFRTESITKWTTKINTHWEATQRVMATKLTRLTHKIVIQLQLVAENCTICSSLSRRQVRKILHTPSYSTLYPLNWWMNSLSVRIPVREQYVQFSCQYTLTRRSQWPRGLRHVLSSAVRTLGLRGWIPARGMDMYMSAFLCVVLSCVRRGLASGWSPVQEVLPNVHRFINSEKLQILNWNRPWDLILDDDDDDDIHTAQNRLEDNNYFRTNSG